MSKTHLQFNTGKLSSSRWFILSMMAVMFSATVSLVRSQINVEIIAGPNVIVDSNVLSPSTYAPDTFTVQVNYCNNTGAPIDNVYAHIGNIDGGGTVATPGIYAVRDSDTDGAFQAESPHLANTGDYSFTHAAAAADSTRYLGTIAPGECKIIYWMLNYPRVSNDGSEPAWGETRLAEDDLWLEMDAWASQVNAGMIDPGNSIGEDSHVATMRNSISAMANKIGGPTGGVWTVTDVAGNPIDPLTPADPGELIKVCGTGFRIGVDNKGFDTDPDFAFDYGVWIQPVGDKSLFDPFCYRLVRTEGQLRISRSGGNPTYTLDFVDQTYFKDLPNDSNGGVGDVCYFLVAMSGPCSAALSPYQLVASGSENEKFNADYGTAVPQVTTGESQVELSKSVDLDNAAAGANLTYDIAFTNPLGSDPLGLPEYGLPLVLNEVIPTGSTYVGGSAEGVVGTETTANSITAGSGGFLDVYYSTNGGVSYASSEPVDPTLVTNIQWWLDSKLQASGTVFVQFQVQVDDPFSGVPLVDNTASLSFGSGPVFKEAVAGTLISGDNVISGMAWEDADYSDTFNSETQTAGVAVTLYYDANGNGQVDAGDILIETQDTGTGSLGADADSTYAFTNLPDGNFIVVVAVADPQIPAGYSLPDSYTDRYVIDLDAAGASGTGVDNIDNDWAFIPALTVTKTADPTTYKEGELVTFEIDLENHMAPVPPADCSHSGFAGRVISGPWTAPTNAQGAPDFNFAEHATSGNDDPIDFGGFDMGLPTPTDTIDSIDVIIRNFYISGAFDIVGGNAKPDYIDIEAWDGAAFVDVIRLDYTTLHNYIGSANQGDIAIAIPPAIVSAWPWATISSGTQDIFRISFEAQGNSDGVTVFVDAVELVVSCPAPPPATSGTSSPSTLDPLPLTDSYDPAKLQFVSASMTPTSVDGGTGTITWDNVGPLHAGNRKTIDVTFLALTPPDAGVDGEPDSTTTTNTASSTGALFLNGDQSNDASDTQDIAINPAGSIGDYIYWDVDGSGTQNAGDLPMQGVTIELLDSVGTVITSTTTDASGFYEFTALDNADYTVRIAASNFAAGGALEGFSQTADPDGGTANESDVTINTADGISTNDSYSDQDFGYDMSNNIISGTLWNDYDGDGIQDANEPPIVGQTVSLSGGGSATTDANGFYIFSDVPDGNYTVSTTAPGGTVLTTAANPIAVDADSGSAIDGTVFPDNDFGFQPSGSLTLGDTVYIDWDGDGSQGAGEQGIENISVYLIADLDGDGAYDPNVDTLVATDVTDASGGYGFAGLASGGDYLVIVDTTDPDFPSNLSQTEDPDATLDSVGEATNLTASDDTFDFGYQPLGSGSIGDTVFVDSDSDGIHDSGEAGIALITVTLYEDSDGDGKITAADAVIGTTVTDVNGNYLFADLAPGDYLVDVDGTDAQLPTELAVDGITTLNYIPTSSDPHAVTLSAGEAYDAADFGFAPGGAIGNFVWQDLDGDAEFDDTEPPISGMTVRLYSDTNGDGVGDVLIDTTLTDADGLYLFDTYNDGGTNTGLPAGDYVVEIVISGTQTVTYDLDGDNDTDTPVALLPGQTFGAADFGVNDSSTLVIGDTVWIDSNGDGIVDEATETLLSGVKVELIAQDGTTVLQTVYTDSLGKYSFGVPDDGSTYSVVIDETTLPFAGLVNTTDRDADLDSDSGQFTMAGTDITDADFGYQFSGPFDISGTTFNDTDSNVIWLSSSEPIYADVVVYLWYSPDGGTTWINIDSQLTGADGSYNFEGYPAGTYTVAVSPGSAVLIGTDPTTPQNLPITVVDQSISDVNFGFVGTSSIGDTVFYDTSGDGIQQVSETGIPGIQVTLTYPNGQTVTTTTDSSGNYLFEGLGSGPYTITIDDSTLPAGTTNTGDPDNVNDSTTLVNLGEGQIYDSGDFGYQTPGEGSIGDTIWADFNGDGVFDTDGIDNIAGNGDDETGIEGVVVELYDVNDPAHDEPGVDPPLATTTTDAEGVYGFSGLIAGDYLVQVITTGTLAGYDPTYDEDGGIVTPNSQTPVNLPTSTSVHDSADFGYLEIKADTFMAWQAAKFGPTDPDRFPASNPDGDLHSNLIEYAFCLDPESGIGSAICLEPRVGTGYDLVFHRRLGSHSDLTYCVLYIDDLANSTGAATSWTEYSLGSLPVAVTVTVTPNPDGVSETVTLENIEALGLVTADKGFFTMAAKLDFEPDGTPDVIDYTDVQGFQRTNIEIAECETCANPFLSKPVFSGKVEGVSSNNLQFGTTTNQGLDFTPSGSGPILETGTSYYVEVLSGTLKGHRLDISTGGSGFVTLASDGDLAAGAPFSTLLTDTGLPSGLDGAEIMIVEHLTLNDIAPPEAFVGNTDPASADRVLFPGNLPSDGSGSWSTYFVLDHPTLTDYWVLQGQGSGDRGGDVIPPCQGFFLHPKSQAVTLEAFGMVRENDFACPLCEGTNLLSAAYPIDLSPNDVDLISPTVAGSGDPGNSDQIFTWTRDGESPSDTDGYKSYWFVDNGQSGMSQIQRWATLGDLSLTDQSGVDFLLGNRSYFLRSGVDHKGYKIGQPWTSLTPSDNGKFGN